MNRSWSDPSITVPRALGCLTVSQSPGEQADVLGEMGPRWGDQDIGVSPPSQTVVSPQSADCVVSSPQGPSPI